jgi:hypothetical protein
MRCVWSFIGFVLRVLFLMYVIDRSAAADKATASAAVRTGPSGGAAAPVIQPVSPGRNANGSVYFLEKDYA